VPLHSVINSRIAGRLLQSDDWTALGWATSFSFAPCVRARRQLGEVLARRRPNASRAAAKRFHKGVVGLAVVP